MRPIYLYETTALSDLIGTEVDIRFCQGRGYNKPSAPGYYAPVLTDDDGILFTRSIYQDRLSFGLGKVDSGLITAVNQHGEYDSLNNYGFGQPARLLLGDEDGDYGDFTVIATGRATAALVGVESLQIGWEDKTAVLKEKASLGIFAGTNSGSTGLEGTANDIGGKSKPRAGGVVKDIEPVLVNAPTRTYAWNYDRDGARVPTDSVDAVRVRGSAWSFGVDHADAAALAAASITVGNYDTCLAESLLRMGGSTTIDGDVRIDVTVGATAADNYAGALIDALLREVGEDNTTINTTELTALDTAKPYLVGYYTRDDSLETLINDLLASILGYSVLDPDGVYRFGFVPATTGTADVTLRKFDLGVAAAEDDVNIISLEAVLDNSKNIPAKQVQVRYGLRWDVQPKANLASGLTDLEQAEISTQWKITDPATNGIEAQFANADSIIYDTHLIDLADAEEVRDDLLDIVGIKPKIYRATVAAQAETIDLFRPGILVDVYYPRFGLSNGYQFFVTQVRVDAKLKQVTLLMRGVGSV